MRTILYCHRPHRHYSPFADRAWYHRSSRLTHVEPKLTRQFLQHCRIEVLKMSVGTALHQTKRSAARHAARDSNRHDSYPSPLPKVPLLSKIGQHFAHPIKQREAHDLGEIIDAISSINFCVIAASMPGKTRAKASCKPRPITCEASLSLGMAKPRSLAAP